LGILSFIHHASLRLFPIVAGSLVDIDVQAFEGCRGSAVRIITAIEGPAVIRSILVIGRQEAHYPMPTTVPLRGQRRHPRLN